MENGHGRHPPHFSTAVYILPGCMRDDEGTLSASIFGRVVIGCQRSARTRLPCAATSKTRKRKINASNHWSWRRFERLPFLTALSGSRYLKPPALPEVADWRWISAPGVFSVYRAEPGVREYRSEQNVPIGQRHRVTVVEGLVSAISRGGLARIYRVRRKLKRYPNVEGRVMEPCLCSIRAVFCARHKDLAIR